MKRLLNWFVNLVKKMTLTEKIGFSLGAVAGVLVCIIVFKSADTTPATELDYAPLESQLESIQKDLDTLLETKGEVKVTDDVIVVILENEECEIVSRFDQNFEMISSIKTDKSTNWIAMLLVSILAGIICHCFSSSVFCIVIIVITILFKKSQNKEEK